MQESVRCCPLCADSQLHGELYWRDLTIAPLPVVAWRCCRDCDRNTQPASICARKPPGGMTRSRPARLQPCLNPTPRQVDSNVVRHRLFVVYPERGGLPNRRRSTRRCDRRFTLRTGFTRLERPCLCPFATALSFLRRKACRCIRWCRWSIGNLFRRATFVRQWRSKPGIRKGTPRRRLRPLQSANGFSGSS